MHNSAGYHWYFQSKRSGALSARLSGKRGLGRRLAQTQEGVAPLLHSLLRKGPAPTLSSAPENQEEHRCTPKLNQSTGHLLQLHGRKSILNKMRHGGGSLSFPPFPFLEISLFCVFLGNLILIFSLLYKFTNSSQQSKKKI